MDSLPSLGALHARRTRLHVLARIQGCLYVQAALRAHRLWLKARETRHPADQLAYHAASDMRHARHEAWLQALADLDDGGDMDGCVHLYRETVAAVDAGCATMERTRLRLCDDDDIGLDQAPGWAFGAGTGTKSGRE